MSDKKQLMALADRRDKAINEYADSLDYFDLAYDNDLGRECGINMEVRDVA